MTTVVHEADELLLGFARALRAAGVQVTQDRAQTYLRAVAAVGLGDERLTFWAGQATLCAGPDDLRIHDQVFAEWFHGERPGRSRPLETLVPPQQARLDECHGTDVGDPDDDLREAASDVEVLRHRDIAELTMDERARLARLFGSLRPRPPDRAGRRLEASLRGGLDTRVTLRRMRGNLGEPLDLAWRRRRTRRRRVVLLVDVSGSMSPYADSLLRLAHRFEQACRAASNGGRVGGVEVFTVGTRITRITRAIRVRDPERAIAAAGQTVPDWSGGTRLGETLKAFLDRWGQRGMARGSVVVIMSDGWERGDSAMLGDQMARLRRLAHRVVWMNPHRGLAGYQPVQQGMAAALPHVDSFVAGHSLAAFADLVEVVAHA
jgi:uncharacterized protein with von Willebrand factor type A (vWA) domain